jgi:hypothetical protein
MFVTSCRHELGLGYTVTGGRPECGRSPEEEMDHQNKKTPMESSPEKGDRLEIVGVPQAK